MPAHKRDRRRPWRSAYVWHRWLGVCCALLVLWLSVTGILLNHSPQFGFDRHYVHSPWLLHAYGIHTQPPAHGFLFDGRWLVQADDQLFLDTRPLLARLRGNLIGMSLLPDLLVAASAESLLLLTPQGELVETLGSDTLPGTVLAIASANQQLLLRTPQGIFVGNTDLSGFTPYSGAWPRQVLAAQPLPAAISVGIANRNDAELLNQERVLTDLHSGRLFGRYGPLFMDAAALGFIVLALSGLWLWWRHLVSRRHRRQRHLN